MNLTMKGLERTVVNCVSKTDKVNVVIYADDFIITGKSKEILEKMVMPAVANFLKVRHAVSKKTFDYVDRRIFQALLRWGKRRHPNKNAGYFRRQGIRDWIFFTTVYDKKRNDRINLNLFHASSVAIKRHIKIKAEATPYDPKYKAYFEQRKRLKRMDNSYEDYLEKALPRF
jgi:RNA-directed DNA polymerase